MNRNILLLEPNYRNKYPPLGLMKLATYHRLLGDKVRFYKGDFKDFVINEIYGIALSRLCDVDSSIFWEEYKPDIREYLKTGKSSILYQLSGLTQYSALAEDVLKYYRNYYYKNKYYTDNKWDRVCVTTLFTFHWKITIETIEFAKKICKSIDQVWVGGILASVVPAEVKKATGVKPWEGLLNAPGIMDDNDLVIENMFLDYSILNEIDYKYPETNAYYAYMTRGCIRRCNFCVVPSIEPEFIPYITLNHKIEITADKYGEQRNLLLLDNNVLASAAFPTIIEEIKSHGFQINSKYTEPNWLDIAIKNLNRGDNDQAWLNRVHDLIIDFLKRLKNDQQQRVYNLFAENHLLKKYTVRKDRVLEVYPQICELYEKTRNKASKKRYVDFNQGIDAKLINKDTIGLLSQLPVRPLRIAFDHWKDKRVYENAIHLAATSGIINMSNYLLYNHDDKPLELYYRLKLNVELCELLQINIYSFPMKYHPIKDPKYFHNRDYIGKNWNRKFVRAVQAVLNSTKGMIGRGTSFFEAAFGMDEQEFFKILYMPEYMIIYRNKSQSSGLTDKWWEAFQIVKDNKSSKVLPLIESTSFKEIDTLDMGDDESKLIQYYLKYQSHNLTGKIY